jgi:hypothetical protein
MNFQSCQIGIHQPNFSPWLGYFNKIYQADKFVFLDNVFIELNSQQAYVNRTRIKYQTGANWLTCPVSRKLSPTKFIVDILFDPNQTWKKKNLKSIYLTYKKAEFFDETYPLIEKLFINDIQHLSVYNIQIVKAICEHLGIDTPIFTASEMNLESSEKNSRIIEICKKLDASSYLSGKGGLRYHDVALFEENEISVYALDFKNPVYPQLYGDFEGGLSIIDVLLNCGKKNTFDFLNSGSSIG